MAICVHPYCIRECLFISDGWEIRSDQPARRDEITSRESKQTHGQAVFRAAGGDEARLERDGMSRVGESESMSLLSSPVLLLCYSSHICCPAEAPAQLSSTAASDDGRERHEALWLK